MPLGQLFKSKARELAAVNGFSVTSAGRLARQAGPEHAYLLQYSLHPTHYTLTQVVIVVMMMLFRGGVNIVCWSQR